MNRITLFFAAIIAAIVLAGCASKGKNMETLATYAILDHKGAATGTNQLPEWVTVYLDSGGMDTAVEKLSQFKGMYCFIGTAESTNKKFAQTWAANVDGPTLIAATISTRVENIINSNENGEDVSDAQRDEASMNRIINAVRNTVQSATFNGARNVGDWWIQIRTYDPDDHSVVRGEEYRAYALYTIDSKSLDQQMIAKLQNIIANDKAMSADERATYNRLINRIQERGLGVEPPPAPATTVTTTVPGRLTTSVTIPQ
ncbi:MAG: hypothetical protein LBS64_05810 [Spirochaetaceae bacterium]|jgi:outer membrane murein-binding lipoprotein Lpp|nr:hypothetical protein [Spirochaetaceae bacterium]